MAIVSLKISLLIMGLSGILAQILLLRELLVSFYGNELTVGIIVANWLALEAIGSFLIGKSVERTERKIEIYVLLQLIFSVAFPACLYLSRIFKNILLTTPGEAVGFCPIFYCSFLVLLPVAIPHGALFTYGSNNLSRERHQRRHFERGAGFYQKLAQETADRRQMGGREIRQNFRDA